MFLRLGFSLRPVVDNHLERAGSRRPEAAVK
jgi:hypothetical protein